MKRDVEKVGCVKRTIVGFRALCCAVRFTHPTMAFLLAWSVLLPVTLPAQTQSVPNAEFDAGDDAPAGWTLSGGGGRWVDRQLLEVTGTGSDSNYWRSGGFEFTPGKLYHFEMRARRTSGSGCTVAGPSFANHDYSGLSNEWTWYGHVFRAPENPEGGYLRLGQWEAKGAVQFDAVRITPVLPVHRMVGDMVLGEGESIRDGTYQFHGTFGHEGSNFHRTLRSATAGFNSNRWVFGDDSQVTYRFDLPGRQFLSGQVSFNVNYHTRGGCLAEVSRDGTNWNPLVTQEGLGVGQAAVPGDLLPAEKVFLRLRTSAGGGSFQVDRVEFRAELDGRPEEATGESHFADVKVDGQEVAIEQITLQDYPLAGETQIEVSARSVTADPWTVSLNVVVTAPDGSAESANDSMIPLTQPGKPATVRSPIRVSRPGRHVVDVSLQGARDKVFAWVRFGLSVPDFYRTDYGRNLAVGTDDAAIWWCDATRKVPKQRGLPTGGSDAAALSAARNDYEAVQIVVRPKESLKGLTAEAGPLVGPGDASIPAENIKISRVHYHYVDHPTDSTGVRDWWPDALPPLDEPIDVAAGENQPLWILVHVPEEARAGDYQGEIRLEAEGFSAAVPIRLHVWDFALPEQNHVETAFGFSAGEVFRYHQLKDDADKRKVLDLYFKSFSEHRISPYDPSPMDGIGVRFLPEADPPRAEVDFSAFDPAMTRAVEEYHFTGLRLPIQGMGGGTFHARYEPKIEGFGEETPQYQAMFSSYVKQLEEHFREKDWLEMAYIYWFDEPAPKDYEFVRKGFERLKKHAPGLRTMLTEQPEEALAGPVDIWCAITPNYDHEAAEKRRPHGERFWWYVCTGPKAPYCTLFIDHPATELRVWLWQTWKRKIEGVLVWQSNYWTSGAAFPDQVQNPYDDPMGYVSGYSTPRGVKRFWGNGDGRFIYPPLAAATPGASRPGPVVEPPASSIRWEMLREGIEDYEYLHLLRELIAKRRGDLSPDEVKKYEALLEVPESISKNMTTFTTDPAPIYARRAAIAEAIEQLAK
ncbi:MAG: glycoside hydrolase domain-containing protein [Planctomycetota bacterium]